VFLVNKYREAAKVYAKQLAEFQNLDSCIPDDTRAAWCALPLEAQEGPKDVWTSVFSTPSSKGWAVFRYHSDLDLIC
jgi:hypothetical protein